MLDQTTETKTGLTPIEVSALRKANRVCFFHRIVADTTGETSYIEAIKENRPSGADPFARDQSIVIPCEWHMVDYTRGAKLPFASPAFHAFVWICAAQSTPEWQTIAGLLRVGDKLQLEWERGAFTTENMTNATPAFYGDKLLLRVERGDKRLTFLIDTCFSEDNSARMIRA